MLDFLEQLRQHNLAIPPDGRRERAVGFYGEWVYICTWRGPFCLDLQRATTIQWLHGCIPLCPPHLPGPVCKVFHSLYYSVSRGKLPPVVAQQLALLVFYCDWGVTGG